MTITAKAHGMAGTLVEPDWPPLTMDEVRALLAGFPQLGEASEILTCSPRPFSAASVVATERGRVFVKRHPRAVRDREGLLEEHRLLAHLHAHGAQVPYVCASAEGETAIERAGWTYEIHQVPPGIDLYQDAISWTPFLTAAHARSAGAALARLHLAAQGYTASGRKPQPLVAGFTIFAGEDVNAGFDTYLDARPALDSEPAVRPCCDFARELLAPFHAGLSPYLPVLPPLWTQNDLHASNLFWSDPSGQARATAIIDFGLADRTNAVHDLANAIERNIVEWLRLDQNPKHFPEVPVHYDHLIALLEGYNAVRSLSQQEAAALAPMTALCHAEFALSEADYYLGVLHSSADSKANAARAYDGYLVGHARWFRSDSGTRLLDAIQRWAAARKVSAQ